jgi:short subunit dehydrogenase-like uncharacterized protein
VNASLLLYGATGYTGKLLARACLERGLAPVLAGRNEGTLRALSAELGLECRVLGLDQPHLVEGALRGIAVAINAAGPFSVTATPLLQACLRAGVHYLDVSGEVAVIDRASRQDGEAKRRKVMIMPSVGFDVVSSDCLAAHVAQRSRGAKRLFIGISGLELLSRGSARTMIEQLTEPVWVRRSGRLETISPGSMERPFDYGGGPRPSVVVSWADVATAYFTTGISEVSVYFEATAAVRAHHMMLQLFGNIIPFTPWQGWLRTASEWMPEGPPERERAKRRAVVVAEVETADGRVLRSRLTTPEVYSFTAQAGAAITERVLCGDLEPGFQTPARIYGADFVLSLPGVSREDLCESSVSVRSEE